MYVRGALVLDESARAAFEHGGMLSEGGGHIEHTTNPFCLELGVTTMALSRLVAPHHGEKRTPAQDARLVVQWPVG